MTAPPRPCAPPRVSGDVRPAVRRAVRRARLFAISAALFALAAALPGCCENQYALRAALNEIRACEKSMAELETETAKFAQSFDMETTERIYKRSSAIRDGLRACRMTLYWSKNIDLVADNPRVRKAVRRNRTRFLALEKGFARSMEELARRRPAMPPPAAEPPVPEQGDPSIPDEPREGEAVAVDGEMPAAADGPQETPPPSPEPSYPPEPTVIE